MIVSQFVLIVRWRIYVTAGGRRIEPVTRSAEIRQTLLASRTSLRRGERVFHHPREAPELVHAPRPEARVVVVEEHEAPLTESDDSSRSLYHVRISAGLSFWTSLNSVISRAPSIRRQALSEST